MVVGQFDASASRARSEGVEKGVGKADYEHEHEHEKGSVGKGAINWTVLLFVLVLVLVIGFSDPFSTSSQWKAAKRFVRSSLPLRARLVTQRRARRDAA